MKKFIRPERISIISLVIFLSIVLLTNLNPRSDVAQKPSQEFSPIVLNEPGFFVLQPKLVEVFRKSEERINQRGFALGFYPGTPLLKTNFLGEVRQVSDYIVISNIFDRDTLKAKMAKAVSWGLLPLVALDPGLSPGGGKDFESYLAYVLKTKSPATLYLALGSGDRPATDSEKANLNRLIGQAQLLKKKLGSLVKIGLFLDYESFKKSASDELNQALQDSDFLAFGSHYPLAEANPIDYFSEPKLASFSKEKIILGLGASANDQRRLIQSFPDLNRRLAFTIFIWRDLYDPPQNVAETRQGQGLWNRDGSPKAAYETWQAIFNGRSKL